jgi:hypothetical protein
MSFSFFKNLIENDEKQNLISDGLFNKLLDGLVPQFAGKKGN